MNTTAESYNLQAFIQELVERYRRVPCVLCGEIHPLQMHCYPERKIRDPKQGTNQIILIVSILCERAKQLGRQYTKRMLPEFVIPECNIRHDRVLAVVADQQGERIDISLACEILGTVCERTIRRHVQAIQRMITEAMKEAAELLARLLSFGILPDMKVCETLYGRLVGLVGRLNEAARKMGGGGGKPVTEGACTHRVYCYRRSRKDLSVSLSLVFRSLLIFDTS